MSFDELSGNVQFFTFLLADEVFALEISKVREVLEFSEVTKIPRVPDFMRGVINLRGSVVPVMDLRLKFGMSETVKTVNTCIIIVEVEIKGELIILGALADSVKEVMDIDVSKIEPPPKIGTSLNTEFLKGMGKDDGEFVMILDINKVFSFDEIELVKDVNESNPISAETEEREQSLAVNESF